MADFSTSGSRKFSHTRNTDYAKVKEYLKSTALLQSYQSKIKYKQHNYVYIPGTYGTPGKYGTSGTTYSTPDKYGTYATIPTYKVKYVW